ncbi:penicillin-binding protein 1C [Flocculibacter collagenilyticus]|uniref:penicillin-binding protein 1C n=1 Tax=Flocculibacter collagenilyticus TaxID=2744479 RepID=UPI0018F69AEB|nr:penicillin-binding protein 1C [Flocculibacter collagenilyticus]
MFQRQQKVGMTKKSKWTVVLFATLVIAVMVIKLLDHAYPLNLPKHNQLFARVVVDEHDVPLRTFADEKGIWRYPIALPEVSPLYIEALINYEDRWFWSHPGINPFSLLRAMKQNVLSGRIVSGGSTLSMQVARILHPHERSMWGKLKQMMRTIQLEWHLEKAQILQLYLNTAPFGGTIEGVQAASFSYLNKSAKQLTHAEAALLAVLPQAPTRYRPDLHNQAAQQARDKVLQRLAKFGVWSQEVVDDAKLEQVYSFNFRPEEIAPLLSRRLLAFSDGQSVVKSTLNSDLQQAVKDVLTAYMSNQPKYSSAAVLVVDNHTSSVKAYVGTAAFADESRFGYIDMIQAVRSPGSTLKPFLYGLAMDEGLIHSHSLLADVPRSWGAYRPSNFNGAFNGPVSATEALQRSLNMPAVDLLARYGVNRFVAQLANAGLPLTIPQASPNLSVVLGGAGTSLEKLVQAYSSLANQGMVSELRFLQNELAKPKQSRRLLSVESAWVIQDALAKIRRPDSINTLAVTAPKQPLAWKTGTSYGHRDSWAIGVNKDYTVGVWLGRPDGTAMPGHHGRVTAGPLLFSVADLLGDQPESISKPENVEQAAICWPLGTLMHEQAPRFCQQQHMAWIINRVVPPTWHTADNDAWQSGIVTYWINADSGLSVTMDCNVASKRQQQVAVWPKVLEPWVSHNARRHQLLPELDDNCRNTALTQTVTLKITGVVPNSIFRKSGEMGQFPSVWLKSIGGAGDKNWYINGKYKYTTPANNSKEHILSSKGQQQIMVQDQQGNTDMVTINVL